MNSDPTAPHGEPKSPHDDINQPSTPGDFYSPETDEILLAKEYLTVGKKEISERREFEKFVEERQVQIPVELMSQDISVERIPKNKVVSEMPMTREVDGKTIIPIVREEIVVTKRYILVEEVVLTKAENRHTEVINEVLREEKFREK